MINSLWRVVLLVTCAFAAQFTPSAKAAYPEHTVHIIIPFGIGGASDFSGRLIAQKLSEKWGQPVVVENREGANATIGADLVAHAQPDGYTLLLTSQAHSIAPATMKVNYDPDKGFAAITEVAAVANLLVINPDHLKVKSVKELIALAKSKPGKLNFASLGTSDPAFMTMALMMKKAGIDMVNVTYKGAGQMLSALLSGEIDLLFGSITGLADQVKAGKITALGVSSKDRNPSLPDIPTIAESGGLPDFDVAVWYGFFTTGGTPKNIVDKLHDDIVSVVNRPDVKPLLEARGFSMVLNSPGDFDAFVKKDMAQIGDVMKALNVQKQ